MCPASARAPPGLEFRAGPPEGPGIGRGRNGRWGRGAVAGPGLPALGAAGSVPLSLQEGTPEEGLPWAWCRANGRSTRGEALFRCARPSGVPRGPATSTGSLASQRHPGKFPKVPGRRRGTRGFPAALKRLSSSSRVCSPSVPQSPCGAGASGQGAAVVCAGRGWVCL